MTDKIPPPEQPNKTIGDLYRVAIRRRLSLLDNETRPNRVDPEVASSGDLLLSVLGHDLNDDSLAMALDALVTDLVCILNLESDPELKRALSGAVARAKIILALHSNALEKSLTGFPDLLEEVRQRTFDEAIASLKYAQKEER